MERPPTGSVHRSVGTLATASGDQADDVRHILTTATCSIWLQAIGSVGRLRAVLEPQRPRSNVGSVRTLAATLASRPVAIHSTSMMTTTWAYASELDSGLYGWRRTARTCSRPPSRGGSRDTPGFVEERGSPGANRAIQLGYTGAPRRHRSNSRSSGSNARCGGSVLRHRGCCRSAGALASPRPRCQLRSTC